MRSKRLQELITSAGKPRLDELREWNKVDLRESAGVQGTGLAHISLD